MKKSKVGVRIPIELFQKAKCRQSRYLQMGKKKTLMEIYREIAREVNI